MDDKPMPLMVWGLEKRNGKWTYTFMPPGCPVLIYYYGKVSERCPLCEQRADLHSGVPQGTGGCYAAVCPRQERTQDNHRAEPRRE